ncbi:hypothetical protein J7E22_16720 [Curtobacterium sp. ISL-83]|nr:hypothetical protein [Curtobacterium sp. ISL-83]
MKKSVLIAAPALALFAAVAAASPAMAGGSTSYQATLTQLNGSHATGNVTLSLSGNQATITEHVSGLAATFSGKPYPHVQHIHIGADGTCPTTAADTNHDGVISTTEGAPSYGAIGTTLSTSGDTSPAAGTTLTVAPSGASYTYNRTIDLSAATLASLQAGKAVVVVHGLDPATLSAAAQAEKSDLVPSLPLAATSPALCGTLVASQMTMPTGGAQTGGGATASGPDLGLLGLGGGLLAAAAAAGTVVMRRKQLSR